jgi:hypothetical protein
MISTLGCHLDALYHSVYGELNESVELLLQAAKDEAKERESRRRRFASIPGVPGGDFYIQAFGRGKAQYILRNSAMYLEFSTWANMPALHIQFSAITLYEYDVPALQIVVQRLIAMFLASVEREKVSRVDVAVDFQQPDFEMPALGDIKTRAVEGYRNTRRQHITAVTHGHRRTMQVQIYRKSERLKADKKEWMREVWRATGRYDEQLPVIRVELRFFRELLNNVRAPGGATGINSLDDLEGSLGDLVRYAVSARPGAFYRICDPEHQLSETHQSRRNAAPWWSAVVECFHLLTSTQGRERVQRAAQILYSAVSDRAFRGLARAAALARVAGFHRAQHAGQFARDLVRAHLVHEPSYWSELVAKYQDELVGVIAMKAA